MLILAALSDAKFAAITTLVGVVLAAFITGLFAILLRGQAAIKTAQVEQAGHTAAMSGKVDSIDHAVNNSDGPTIREHVVRAAAVADKRFAELEWRQVEAKVASEAANLETLEVARVIKDAHDRLAAEVKAGHDKLVTEVHDGRAENASQWSEHRDRHEESRQIVTAYRDTHHEEHAANVKAIADVELRRFNFMVAWEKRLAALEGVAPAVINEMWDGVDRRHFDVPTDPDRRNP